MKKTLLSLAMLVSIFASAHEHEEINLVNATVYKNKNAIVETVELGKTDDDDYAMELHDFGTSFELEKVNNIFYSKDLRIRAKEENNKLVNELVIPLFDRSVFNKKYKRGFDFHSFPGSAHIHINISENKKQVEINGKVFNVDFEDEDNVLNIYTEKTGKFVLTTYVDPNNRIQAFATLISTSVYSK